MNTPPDALPVTLCRVLVAKDLSDLPADIDTTMVVLIFQDDDGLYRKMTRAEFDAALARTPSARDGVERDAARYRWLAAQAKDLNGGGYLLDICIGAGLDSFDEAVDWDMKHSAREGGGEGK